MMHRLSIRLACCAVFVLTIPYALPGESSDRVQEALEILEGEGVLENPQDVMAWISMPRQLKRKGSAKLEVFVLNGRADDTLSLRAKRRGVYIGDIDVLEGESFLTRAAQAQVK